MSRLGEWPCTKNRMPDPHAKRCIRILERAKDGGVMLCEIGTGAGGENDWMIEACILGRSTALQTKTCQNTAGAVRCEKLSKPFSLWQCADYEPVELPCSADVRTAGRCHCGRKYCGGKAKCLCTGQCKCPERSVRRMFSTRICCRCFRRTGGKSGTFTGKI